MASLADVKLVHSGGASNNDPLLDLGGVKSTDAAKDILSQSATAPTTITGVTIDDAAGNDEGDGSLVFNFVNKTLRWTPFGGTAGTAVDVSANGDYAIQGGNNGGLLKVTVVASSLPSSDQTNTITIANLLQKIFDDVTKAESLAGSVKYRGIFIQNDHASESMVNGKLYIAENTPGQDTIQIAMAAEAKNLAMATIADEDTAPSAIDFDAVNPINAASGLVIPTLDFGDYIGFWLKRTVPANTSQAELENTFKLGIQVFV